MTASIILNWKKKAMNNLKDNSFFMIILDILFSQFPRILWPINKQFWKYKLQKAMDTKELVLRIAYGGLGDHLLYSAIPEALDRHNIKVMLSQKSNFRDKSIKNFIWKNNPHVEFSDKKGLVLNCPRIPQFTDYASAFFDVLDIDPININNMKIYYEPKRLPANKGDVLCDMTFGPSGLSNGYEEPAFQKSVVDFIQNNYPNRKIVLLLPQNNYPNRMIVDKIIADKNIDHKIISVRDLYNLTDLLYSYGERILLYSGAASICAAFGLESTVLCNKLGNPYFRFKTNNYVFLGKENYQIERGLK